MTEDEAYKVHIPVSYTHLYLTREKLWEVATSPEALLKLCSDLLAEREKNAALREDNARLQGKAVYYDLFIDLRHSTNPVSYTHLDVYKRQVVHPGDTGVENSSGAHGAGLQCHIELTLVQPPGAQGSVGLGDGLHLRMGGSGLQLLPAVAAPAHHLSFPDNDAPHGHLPRPVSYTHLSFSASPATYLAS